MSALRVSQRPGDGPEIFRSIQGEGVSAGAATVFLRLATCNLTCTWCDTKYTWDWQNHRYDEEVGQISLEEALERIEALGTGRVVITGGEPLMQQKALTPLVEELHGKGYLCEVETNGTLAPSAEMAFFVKQWNVSPKLGNSGTRPERREVPRALTAFVELPNAYFKFVVSERPDVDEVDGLVTRYGIPSDRVLLMPEGTTPAALGSRSRWVAELCAEKGYRFTTRLHILLWGDERGR